MEDGRKSSHNLRHVEKADADGVRRSKAIQRGSCSFERVC
jgi:hypothetical protein